MLTFINESVNKLHDLQGGNFIDFLLDFVERLNGGKSANVVANKLYNRCNNINWIVFIIN